MAPSIVTHIISLHYKEPSANTAPEVAARFQALATECKTEFGKGRPYILSFSAGSNCNPSGREKGMQHTFISTFPNLELRDYYLDEDPAHQAFKAFIAPLVQDIFAFDFIDGVYYFPPPS